MAPEPLKPAYVIWGEDRATIDRRWRGWRRESSARAAWRPSGCAPTTSRPRTWWPPARRSRSRACDSLIGRHLDLPTPGTRVAGAITVVGWALGRERRVVLVRLESEAGVGRDARLGVDRPDLAAAFPRVERAGMGGFRGWLSLAELPADARVVAVAVLDGAETVPLGEIRLRGVQ